MRTESGTGRRSRDVLRWRRERLVQAGVPPPLATRLAHDERYDLHVLIELIEGGCPPELAARILAPLDMEHAA
jgi:hypothetical protein